MSNKQTVWILTSEYNEYDQMGEYYEAVFSSKPSTELLAEVFKDKELQGLGDSVANAVRVLEHIRSGGGRIADENVWYLLKEVTPLE